MNHKLHVLVRLGLDPQSASLIINGCLTDAGFPALFAVIRRTQSLVPGLAVTVDLSRAKHIDAAALVQLQHVNPEAATLTRQGTRGSDARPGRVTVIVPETADGRPAAKTCLPSFEAVSA